jgi:N utilization substance protein A
MVVSELRGEKIDIIPYNDEPARFVAKALSPARVREVLVDDDARQATVVVPDDQLSLAIGREGQNARLAARLTGWRIDIKSETEFATEEPEGSYPEEETGGRCAAILGNGRRCPNAALPGSRFCGLDSHQALEGTGTVYVAGEPPAEVLGDNGEVEEAVAEEALAAGLESSEANDGLVEEAVGEEPAYEEVAVEEVAADEADPLEPAPEASEPDALAADTEPALEATDGQPLPEAATAEPAPAEETAEEPAS